MSIVLAILMQIWRWSHAGRVCSGDHLDGDTDCDETIYLCFEGKFIKAMLITIYCMFCAALLSIVVVAICVHKKHSAEEKKAREKSDGELP